MRNHLRVIGVLAAFALASVVVTVVASGLALERASLSHLNLETRSRLVADYTSDPLASRLEPLNPAVIQAAVSDEAGLSGDLGQPAPADSSPAATATVRPPGAPTDGPSPPPAVTGTPAPRTPTPFPSSTVITPRTPEPPLPSATTPKTAETPAPPRATPTPSVKPSATASPVATAQPQPTAKPATPTATAPAPKPIPTATPTPPPAPTATPSPTVTPSPTPAAGPSAEETTQSLVNDLQALTNAEGCPGSCTVLGDKVEDALAKAQTALALLQLGSPDEQASIGTLNSAAGDLQAALGLDPPQDPAIQDFLDRIDAIISMLQAP